MVEYILVPKNTVNMRKTNLLTLAIYNNFINLSKLPDMKHTTDEINKLLNSNNSYLFLCLHDGKIIGYLLGEITKLPDKRDVFYITYLFTASHIRKRGVGSKLMMIVEEFTKNKKLDGVLLTCDTENFKVYDFYQKKGYMLDFHFRKYDRYDILYKGL